eukprot:gnl/MRDRNA2_/MRDRNA2_94915_c0_seq1.p1 gnl/MRDRNA2_/MRDRNA2_94915_c0~~gnl/MRDRNA2_/MRDRNA2_94915_c0_seq1.p1  ORF type:complete len:129 (-),score=22.08 gnl/MRDRNA2_/MRDRNA2_94915_c0_seq1:216-602(-)
MVFSNSASKYVCASESESLLPRFMKHDTGSEFVQGHTLQKMSNGCPVESAEALGLDESSFEDLGAYLKRTGDSKYMADNAAKELPKHCLPGHAIQRMPCIWDLTPYVEKALELDAELMNDSDSSDDEA